MRSEVQVLLDPPFPAGRTDGALAQLGERLICIQEVRSSILLGSTIRRLDRQAPPWRFAVQSDDFDIVKRDTITTPFDMRKYAPVSVRCPGPFRGQGERMIRLLPQPSMRLPAETSGVVQVKYTNHVPERSGAGKYDFWFRIKAGRRTSRLAATDASLSFSGSNQAREGRLVNALAVRGDEGRDTLR